MPPTPSPLRLTLALAQSALLALPARSDDTSSIPIAQPESKPAKPPEAEPSGVTPLVPPTALSEAESARINATARGLAGLKASWDGATWESTPEWADYSAKLDSQWSYVQRVRLTAMRVWANAQLGDLRDKTSTVFYPFSGPDVLYADTLFPNSKVLLMAGLEPIGTLPDLARVQQEGNLAPCLAQMKTSLYTILVASFFKTKDMKTDFNNQLINGLVPAMVVFLAHQGLQHHRPRLRHARPHRNRPSARHRQRHSRRADHLR